MLSKLIKHEFIATRRAIPLVNLVMLVMLGMYLLGHLLDLTWLIGSGLFVTILAIAAQTLVTFIIVIARFGKSLYGAEGYLTHTLPVKSSSVFWSKTIVGTIWMAVSTVLSIAAIVVVIAVGIPEIHDVWNIVWTEIQRFGVAAVISVLLLYLLSSLIMTMGQIYASIAISGISRFHSYTVSIAVVMYLAINTVIGVATSVLLFLFPPFIGIGVNGLEWSYSTNLIDMFTNSDVGVVYIGITGLFITLLIGIALLVFAQKLMEKKLSLK